MFLIFFNKILDVWPVCFFAVIASLALFLLTGPRIVLDRLDTADVAEQCCVFCGGIHSRRVPAGPVKLRLIQKS